MKISTVPISIAIVVSLGSAGWAQAPVQTAFSSMAVLSLKNGPNQIDLDGDGRADLVFVAWRDNANAHGFDHITFYHSVPGTSTWNLVPLFSEDETSNAASFETFRGADCVLRDLRVLKSRNQPAAAVIVAADRSFGETFISKEPVTFTVYRAARNADGIPGTPPFYFRAAERITSKAAYCDVGEAFRSELGIGR